MNGRQYGAGADIPKTAGAGDFLGQPYISYGDQEHYQCHNAGIGQDDLLRIPATGQGFGGFLFQFLVIADIHDRSTFFVISYYVIIQKGENSK